MFRSLVFLMCVVALAATARADMERRAGTYPFRVERSAKAGQQITGAQGAVIYRERSLGREAAFLTTPMPAGKWPIQVSTGEPLFPIVFAEKGVESLFYCSDRFKVARGSPRETLCFRDREKDGRFDQVAIGERNEGFIFEITGRWIEATEEDIEGSRTVRVRAPRAVAPTRYAIMQIRPRPEEASIIEVRYAGLQGGRPAFDVSLHSVHSQQALYTNRIVALKRHRTALRATLPHPVVAYRIGRKTKPRIGLTGEPFPATPDPVPPQALEKTTMIVDIIAADVTRVRATIAQGYPAWSLYQQNCDDDASVLVHVEEGPLPALVEQRETGLCEKTSWVQDGSWWIVGTENASSGPLGK